MKPELLRHIAQLNNAIEVRWMMRVTFHHMAPSGAAVFRQPFWCITCLCLWQIWRNELLRWRDISVRFLELAATNNSGRRRALLHAPNSKFSGFSADVGCNACMTYSKRLALHALCHHSFDDELRENKLRYIQNKDSFKMNMWLIRIEMAIPVCS